MWKSLGFNIDNSVHSPVEFLDNCWNPKETKIGSFLLLWPGAGGIIGILLVMGELVNKAKPSRKRQGDIGRKSRLLYHPKARCLSLCLNTNIGPLLHRTSIR